MTPRMSRQTIATVMSRGARWIAFWTAIGLVFSLPHLSGAADRHGVVVGSLLDWWTWGFLALFVVAVAPWLRARAKSPVAWFVAHLAVGVAASLADTYITVWAFTLAGHRPRIASGGMPAEAAQDMFWNLLIYALVVGVCEAYASNQRYASAELRVERLERNFSEARLNALRMQLDPHFLFNALNTISVHVVHDPTSARAMIEHLGDLLRLSLDSERRQTSTLAEELTFLDHYLAIQKARFGDALDFASDVAPELMQATVPSLFMQPLVENAIRHGLSSRARGGSIAVVARAVERSLDIRVLDDGVGLPDGWTLDSGAGLGLGITRERIAGLYPAAATSFSVRSRPGGGTEVAICIPLHLSDRTLAHASA